MVTTINHKLSLLCSFTTAVSGIQLLANPRMVLLSVRLTYMVTEHVACWGDVKTCLKKELQRHIPTLELWL